MKHKKYLAIFDLDGTLFDTSDVNYFSYRKALSFYGINLDRDYFVNNCAGRHYKEFLPVIAGGETDIENIHSLKKEAYIDYINKTRVNTHLFAIINLIREIYNIALITTASRKNSLEILKFFGYEDLFDLIITQEDVENMKPSPEGFILAMKYFDTDGGHTIIFEDSAPGIEAANLTGASVFIINKF